MPEKSRSVPGKSAKFAVAASPFNPVKLELGIILVVALLWAAVVTTWVPSVMVQMALLALYGIGAMVWLVRRTAKVSRHEASKLRDGTS